MVINLSVKTERNRRSKIVGSKIEHYIEIENELISTKKDGSEDDIFAFRQNWILEKKINFNNDSKIKEETEN
ncbi:hypothetical protein N8475_00010 [Winogradskyella sp.]|nr:hypothetical protein [Winogradskyella sp.]